MEYFISDIIAHCAVPGFFVIASVLLYKKEFQWLENIKKKVRTLVVPWFIVITFWILLYAILQHMPIAKPFFSDESKLISEWKIFQYFDAYLGLTQSPIVYPLWFVQNLFFLNIIALPIKNIIDFVPRLYMIVLIILMLFNPGLPIFCLKTNAFVYFSIGYYIVKYNWHIVDVKKINYFLLSMAYILICFMTYISRETMIYNLIDTLSIIVGLCWWSRTIMFLSECKLLGILGKYSFNIFIMHEMYLRIVLKGTAKIFGTSVIIQLLEYFVVPMGIIAFCVIVSLCMERFAPKFYRIFTGGRS